jgi:hypothetical protein
VFGTLAVNKVAGNFHVAMGDSAVRNAQHIHQFNPGQLAKYNASHTIHSCVRAARRGARADCVIACAARAAGSRLGTSTRGW